MSSTVVEEVNIYQYDKLIKWALHHSIQRYQLTLDPDQDFADLVQTV